MKTKRPAFQFYPADWLNDLALRQCSALARALWADMLCLMHEGDPYGHLRTEAGNIAIGFLARISGLTTKQVTAALAEMTSHKVFSQTEEGTIYSRRMVRDEELRNTRASGGEGGRRFGELGAEHGIKGGRPSTVRGDNKPPLKPSPSSPSSSSTSEKQEEEPPTPLQGDDAAAIADAPPELPGPQLVPIKPRTPLEEATRLIARWIWDRHPQHRRSKLDVIEKRLREECKPIPSVEGKIQHMRDIDARHARWCASEQWAGKGMVNNLGNWFTGGMCDNEPPPPDPGKETIADRCVRRMFLEYEEKRGSEATQ